VTARRRRKGRRKTAGGAARKTAGGARRPWPASWQAPAIFAWGFLVHLVFLLASPELTTPVSAFFFGDSVRFLESARLALLGQHLDAGLPYHPPLVGWLMLPVWWLFEAPRAYVAAKLLMSLINAAGYALFFLLVRRRVPHALWICLLLPLSFGEMLLSAAAGSEAVYRLLLLALLAAGLERPWLAGMLHGAAALCRAEHLPFALLLLAVAAARPAWRGPALRSAAVALLLVLLPYAVVTHAALSDYNARHAGQLPEELPTLVPVSFYGPLNFALAQREEDVFFARRTLPPAPAGMSALDPRFPPHNELILHGYRIGLETIARDPLRFVRRSARKLAFSFQALGYGWTWRDLPNPGRWLRPPVDMAISSNPPYLLAVLALIAAGAWRLRAERALLLAGGVLLAYRLAVNVAFFPYLRSMMIVSPFWLLLLSTGLHAVAGRLHRALTPPRLFAALLVLLAAFHLTAFRDRRYLLDGERDERGLIIDDRPVTITFAGYR